MGRSTYIVIDRGFVLGYVIPSYPMHPTYLEFYQLHLLIDINFQSGLCHNPILHALPQDGETAVLLAARYGHQRLVQELCQPVGDGSVEFGAEESDEVEEYAEKMACVKIGSEEFSIVEVPSSATTVVRKQKEYLLGSIDLSVLVEDLSHVGNDVRLAYNGTAEHTELQIQIREIGYDVTKFCDKSAITVSKFKEDSGSILDDLQGTYQFLLDGLEDIALEAFASLSEVAKSMATAAEELHEDFANESLKVEEVLKDTMKEERKKKEIEEKERKFEVDRIPAENQREAFEQEYAECEKQYREAEEKQEKAQASEQHTAAEELHKDFADESLKVEGGLKGTIKEKRDEEMKTMDILAKLSSLMLNVALFWKQMQMHCETLARDKMQKMVMRAMKRPKKERLRVWTASSVKKQAITIYAQWVALNDVCASYMAKIKETLITLYSCLTHC